ncbi:hypothetical protein SteCoe_21603 [Stentor coeruleus]|uniref:Uncharacterized protein n=1 Tax=Stentor coeruleus TaxID=5963 RepID=A0A1R2BP23_9CILI|nr:hypothetical protein SteCoe_21603 [Stentor coeruleus]
MLRKEVKVISLLIILYFCFSFFILDYTQSSSPSQSEKNSQVFLTIEEKNQIIIENLKQNKSLESTSTEDHQEQETTLTQEPTTNIVSNSKTNIISNSTTNIVLNPTSDYSSPSQCRIPDHDFTQEEIKKYFKYNQYGSCPGKGLELNTIKDNVVISTCHNGNIPKTFIDDGSPQILGGTMSTIKYQSGSIRDLGNGEYIFIDCDKNEKYAYVINRFKDSISLKAQSKRKELSQNNSTRPLSVLLLIIDSVSKGSAERNFPRTMDLLNKNLLSFPLNNKFSVYNFEKAGALELSTRPNIIPIIFGQSSDYHDNYLKGIKLNNYKQNQKFTEIQEYALWNYYSKLGYVTMFSFETVMDYLAQSTGRFITADYVLANFWRASKKIFGFSEFREAQRCFGTENALFYGLNYTAQFFKNYKNHNRFAYVHTMAAHENTGNVQTIDHDLPQFLEYILELHNNKEEDLLIYLMSDHGRGQKDLYFSLKGYFDHRQVINYIILNKELEKSLNSQENLSHNQKHLLGRYDINLSLKSLAHHPYGGLSEKEKLDIKNKYIVRDAIDLFNQKIKPDRTCEDIGFTSDMCLCRDYDDINFDNSEEKIITSKIIELSLNYILSNRHDTIKCAKPIFNEIVSGSKFYLKFKSNGWDTNYRLDFSVQGDNIVYVSANFATKKRVEKLKIAGVNKMPFTYFNVYETEVYLEIEEVIIRNTCEKILCVCIDNKV